MKEKGREIDIVREDEVKRVKVINQEVDQPIGEKMTLEIEEKAIRKT